MILASKTRGVLLLLLLCAGPAFAQISIGLQYGAVSGADKDDPYALNSLWPSLSNNQSDGSLVFFSKGTGTSLVATVGYDVTRYFSASMVYRMTKFTTPEEHREGSLNSLGAILRLNFVSNEKKVIPFIQGEFMFANSNNIKQTSATSTKYPTQTSPAFDQSFTTSLGVGGDLGIEFKLNQAVGLLIQGGYHGLQIANDDKAFIGSLDYGPGVTKPSNLDGVFFFQGTAGLKYYFGKGKKKRDF